MITHLEILIATWESGHTLTRGISRDDSDGSLFPNRPTFGLNGPDGHVLFVISVRPGQEEVDIYLDESTQTPSPKDYLLHRKLIASAVVEVLGLGVTPQLAQGILLSPIVKWPDHVEQALEHSLELERLARAIESESNVKRNADLRRDYIKLAVKQLQYVPIDGVSGWFDQRDRTNPLYISSTSVKRSVRNSDWQVMFRIDFASKLRCSVLLKHKNSSLASDLVVTLGESDVSPLHAILDAGLIVPALLTEGATHIGRSHQIATLSEWVDELLEDAPEVAESFDVEPYRLLGESLPYLWGPKDFVGWAESMGALP